MRSEPPLRTKKQKPDRGEWFCRFFCCQPCSGQQAAKNITALPRATTVPGHITEETQSTSLTTIDFIIAALATGMAARIMSGRQVTGHSGPVSVPPLGARYLTLVSYCGSMGVTSRKDTKPLRLARRRHVSRLVIAGTSLIRLLKFLKFALPLSIDGWFPPGGGLICFAKPWKCLRASYIAF